MCPASEHTVASCDGANMSSTGVGVDGPDTASSVVSGAVFSCVPAAAGVVFSAWVLCASSLSRLGSSLSHSGLADRSRLWCLLDFFLSYVRETSRG